MRLQRLVPLTALLSLAFAGSAAAQVKFAAISGGATYGDICCAVNTDHRWGGTAGVTVGYRGWNYVAFNLEANWIQKGGGDTRVDYIEIPFLVGGTYGSGGGLRARVYTGLGVAFPIGCSSEAVLLTCDQKKTEWAWPFGIQVGKWTPSDTFFALDVRYSLGLSDTFETLLAHNRSWQFRLFVGKRFM